ncbi:MULTISPECIES: TetR/AcrR family transcriptional regulator [Glycomyces]|uniref:AcrR family transcriptional regulator n=2 Tax=Glycomyces TaxID=58113 RepID=A0A9X3SWR1_9ACTN|nr:TetR/AcrR family transcriptional regulator [Glycomyces lechevalierae]MDA1387599.1 TetR/AcrR family transcriptional regulator [Glycomyces lechevalierae]MDR7336635.1 AcrR family transcriptional regulator [Glycomyces lechevalierae]
MSDGQRADARRNYERILAVAVDEVAEHGVNASLEQIARVAGVGSATVRRHFPSRRALLEAVSHKRIEDLSDRARELAGTGESRSVLLEWLNEVVDYSATARGLAAVLVPDSAEVEPAHVNGCAATLEDAASPLLQNAKRDGTVSSEVMLADLLALIAGIAMATEHYPDPAAQAHHLFRLAAAGLGPQH